MYCNHHSVTAGARACARIGSRTKSHWTKTHRTISKRTKSQEDKNPGGQNPMGTKAQGDKIQVRQKPRGTKAQGDKTPQGQKPMEDNIQADNIPGGQNPKIFMGKLITMPPAVGFIYTRSTTRTPLPICVSPGRPAGPVKPLHKTVNTGTRVPTTPEARPCVP